MKGVLSGGRMVWVDKVLGGNQIGGIMCFTRIDRHRDMPKANSLEKKFL